VTQHLRSIVHAIAGITWRGKRGGSRGGGGGGERRGKREGKRRRGGVREIKREETFEN
jgi:hypothetical protein